MSTSAGPGISKFDVAAAKEAGAEPQPRFLEAVLADLKAIGVPNEPHQARVYRLTFPRAAARIRFAASTSDPSGSFNARPALASFSVPFTREEMCNRRDAYSYLASSPARHQPASLSCATAKWKLSRRALRSNT